MSANCLFSQPFLLVLDTDGNPVVGAQITVFQAGTSTPEDVFTDSSLGVAWSQPIITNAAGQTDGPIYVSPTPALKIVVLDADDVPCPGYPIDNWSPSAVAT